MLAWSYCLDPIHNFPLPDIVLCWVRNHDLRILRLCTLGECSAVFLKTCDHTIQSIGYTPQVLDITIFASVSLTTRSRFARRVRGNREDDEEGAQPRYRRQEHSIDIQKTDVHPPFSPHNILNGKLIPLLRTSFRHPHLALPLRCPFITNKEFIFLEAAAQRRRRERVEATLS